MTKRQGLRSSWSASPEDDRDDDFDVEDEFDPQKDCCRLRFHNVLVSFES